MNGDTTNKIALFPADDLPEGEIRAETLPNGDVIAVYNVEGTFMRRRTSARTERLRWRKRVIYVGNSWNAHGISGPST